MEFFQNRVRREYERKRERRRILLASLFLASLVLLSGVSVSRSSDDFSADDLERMVADSASNEKADDDAVMFALYGWDNPPLMVAHRLPVAAELIVAVDGEPELVQVVKR